MCGISIGFVSSCDHAGERTTCERVQIESATLALIVVIQPRSRDHCRVVGSKSRRRRIDVCIDLCHALLHRRDERAVTRNTTAEYHACAPECIGCAESLLDERSDQSILKSACDVRANL